ncbi:MAG: hypothetical protein HY650_11810 [Acidobacteria bacterium]|nr:hypothetical protein [Acidobacteriota bacterium]
MMETHSSTVPQLRFGLSRPLSLKVAVTLAVGFLFLGSFSGRASDGATQQLVICAKCNVAVSLRTGDGTIRTRCPNRWEKLDKLRCPSCGKSSRFKPEAEEEKWVCPYDGASVITNTVQEPPSVSRTDRSFELEVAPGQRATATTGSKTKVAEYRVLGPGAEVTSSFNFRRGSTRIAGKSLRRSDEDQDHQLFIDLGRRVILGLKQSSILHRLDHDLLTNLGFTEGGRLTVADADPGRNYQIVRSEWKPDVRITVPGLPHVQFIARYRYLTRGGHEQARTLTHCASCHVQAGTRRVDQVTNDLELGSEAKFGPLALYYGHTVRKFNERGQAPRFDYRPAFASTFFPITGDLPYGVIPDSTKRTDKLDLRWDVSHGTSVHAGFTSARSENQFTRGAADLISSNLRITARPLPGLKTTARYQFYEINPTHPDSIDRIVHSGGVEAAYALTRNTSLEAGYELERINRPNVLLRRLGLSGPYERGPWNTSKHGGKLGFLLRPRAGLDVSARYKFQLIDQPLTRLGKQDSFAPQVGRRPYPSVPGIYPDLTNQPTQVQEGFLSVNWRATKTLTLSPVYRFSDDRNSSVDRHQRDHLLTVTATYSPVERLNFSTTYTYDRSRTAAVLYFGSTGGLRSLEEGWVDIDPGTLYRTRIQAWVAGINWMPSRRTALFANYRFTPSSASFDSSIAPDLGGFSALKITSQWAYTGFDYAISPGVVLRASYAFDDYADRALQLNSGSTNLFRIHLSWNFNEQRRSGG